MNVNELKEYKSVQKWGNKIGGRTYTSYLKSFSQFIDFLNEEGGEFKGLNPDELVLKLKDTEEISNSFKRGLMNEKLEEWRDILRDSGLRAGSIKTYLCCPKSFFKKNKCALPQDDDVFKVKAIKTPSVVGKLKVEHIKQIIESMSANYKGVFMSMFQAGLDLDCFERWNLSGWDSLRETLRTGERIHEIAVNGRKNSKNLTVFYTFVGGDSIDLIKAYVENVRGWEEGAIFLNQHGKPITGTAVYTKWHRQLRKSGIIPKAKGDSKSRYGYNVHELRDCFVTQCQRAKLKDFGQVCTGHSIDNNNYAKLYSEQEARFKAYREVEPYISLMSSGVPFGLIEASQVPKEIKAQEDRIKNLEIELDKAKDVIIDLTVQSTRTETPQDALIMKLMDRLSALEKERQPITLPQALPVPIPTD